MKGRRKSQNKVDMELIHKMEEFTLRKTTNFRK